MHITIPPTMASASPQSIGSLHTSTFSTISESSPLCTGSTEAVRLPHLFDKYPPQAFERMSFSPGRDDPKVVKYRQLQPDDRSPSLRCAATLRLIVHITDHLSISYNIMSDFFLSYRLFMDSNDLLEALFARLAWACAERNLDGSLVSGMNVVPGSGLGANSPNLAYEVSSKGYSTTSGPPPSNHYRNIAVRTFVVLRHWVLNFFPDDFVPSYHLRAKFASTLNTLYAWGPVESDAHYRHMFHQLKKAWINSCCMYWKLGNRETNSFDESLPIFAGGMFGDATIGPRDGLNRIGNRLRFSNQQIAASRRHTLLSSYDGPIKPVISGTRIPNVSTGSLIKGGVTLSGDVEVKGILPPTPVKRIPVDNVATSGSSHLESSRNLPAWSSESRYLPSQNGGVISHSHNKGLQALLDLWSNHKTSRLLRKLAHTLDCCTTDHSDLWGDRTEFSNDIIRIDLLSARAIEELDHILKTCSYTDSAHTDQEEEAENDAGLAGSPTKKQRTMRYPSRSTRCYSLLDNLDIQQSLTVANPRKPSPYNLHYSLMPSKSSSASSSYVSYDEDLSSLNSITEESRARDWNMNPRLRRLARHSNLRQAALHDEYIDPNDSDDPQEVDGNNPNEGTNDGDNVNDDSIHPNANYANFAVAYSGVDSQVAAELAAIPDEEPDDNAIESALLRLEGRYVKPTLKKTELPLSPSPSPSPPLPAELSHSESLGSSIGLSVQYSSVHNSNLFKAAFESKLDIAGLRKFSGQNWDILADTSGAANVHVASVTEKAVSNQLKGDATISWPQDYSGARREEQHHYHRLHFAPSRLGRKTLKTKAHNGDNFSKSVLSVPGSVPMGTHTSFILNYGSEQLCRQLTLIERDALAEVDWKELIEMRWNKKVHPTQSWLRVLVDKSVRGVQLIISRFNLMVNWIKSEILLTRSLTDRVHTISRFIHIGHHARKIQNFATVMQIVLALTSGIIANLKNTWSHMSTNDCEILEQLRELVSPLRNFANIRQIVRITDPSTGCIPFLGLYLSDLTFNNERPSYDPENDRLVNFEKFQTSAAIVKSLLQCIEWSCNYTFTVENDLLAKCLYIQSLTAEEMDLCLEYMESA